jgi:hypothetical protein
MSSTGSGTQEIFMLLCHLAASTSTGAVGTVTQSSSLTGSTTTTTTTTTLGQHTAHSSDTYPWYLDSSASFYMTPHSAHLSSLRSSYCHYIVHTADGFPLL